MNNIWLNVCSILFSGIAGVAITIIVQRRLRKKDLKYDVLSAFVQNRFDLNGEEFTKALNNIYLVYAKDKKVLNAMREFHSVISNSDKTDFMANQKLYVVYLTMCKSIHIKHMGEIEFLNPFNIKI